jgi:RNA polymerase sigma factor (sigma-70 family)
LNRFFRGGDDSAFAFLVERHGSLVYGVCRRVLRDANDVEDAFQATFLVLVRKGATLAQPERLSSWLYGVANRTSRKIRAKALIRIRHERKASELPASSDVSSLTLSELRVILEEEIGQLPEKYSLPLALCYLEGKTNAQAAAQLGWPEGSISRRLSRARELLRSRLIRRGLALSVALIAAVFARPLIADAPASLVEATIAAGSLVRQGVPLQSVVSSPTASVVSEIVAHSAGVARLTAATALALGAVVLAILVGIWQFGNPNAPAASAGMPSASAAPVCATVP